MPVEGLFLLLVFFMIFFLSLCYLPYWRLNIEILWALRKPPPLIRPSIPKGTPYPEVVNLMRQCWAEAPESRPSFDKIYQIVIKFYDGKYDSNSRNTVLDHFIIYRATEYFGYLIAKETSWNT